MLSTTQSVKFCIACCDLEGNLCDPNRSGLDLSSLQDLFFRALSSSSKASGAEFDFDDEEEGLRADTFKLELVDAAEGGVPTLALSADSLDLASLQEIQNLVLSGDFDSFVARRLGRDASVALVADRSEFAAQYESSVLSLDRLTDHQREKLEECCGEDGRPTGDVHLMAPAGAGKTFVALHRVLCTLQSSPEASVLFVARNDALAYFASSWIAKRVAPGPQRQRLLARMHVLHEPFDRGAEFARVRRNCIELRSLPKDSPKVAYALVVVDEAHHVYSAAASREMVEGYVSAGQTQRMLLSDVSQSWGRKVAYPAGMREVLLSEVVRCSKRIVAGAMAFQLGGEEKLLTKCHHEATGPPLKSFLFDVPTGQEASPFAAYAQHALRALQHVNSTFSGLDLHNRVALVVPDLEFRESFRPELQKALAAAFPQRRFRFVDAVRASADLGRGRSCAEADTKMDLEGQEQGSGEEGDREEEASEWLVLDSIHQMDGLERLIVVGVGLDSIIDSQDAATGRCNKPEDESTTLATRSMLYRAMTRAHLMFLVVNEFMRGGWLEFLGSVRLREDEAFDSKAALQRSEVQAVEGVVKARLSALVGDAAEELGLSLSEAAATVLTGEVAARHERGQDEGKAIEAVLRQWQYEAQVATEALEKAMVKLGLRELVGTTLAALSGPFALALHRGEVVELVAAASDIVKKQGAKQHDMKIADALEVATRNANREKMDGKVAKALQSRVSMAVDKGETIESAARSVIEEWATVEEDIRRRVQRYVEMLTNQDGFDLSKLEQDAAISACEGENVEDAARRAVSKCHAKCTETQVDTALRSAILAPRSGGPVCQAGGRARLRDLAGKPELNGAEAELVDFLVRGRWSAEVEFKSKKIRITVKPVNLEALSEPGSEPEAQAALLEALPALQAQALAKVKRSRPVAEAVAEVVKSWRVEAAQVASALQVLALQREFHLDMQALQRLTRSAVDRLWRGSGSAAGSGADGGGGLGTVTEDGGLMPMPAEGLGDGEGENGGEEGAGGEQQDAQEQQAGPSLEEVIDEVLNDWMQGESAIQRDIAQIRAALEAAAKSQRVLLTDGAMESLQQRVEVALRRKDSLEVAVDAAIKEWHRQVVRKQVQQTVWDPSGNETRQITGVVRFMPFKHSGPELFDYVMLMNVFTMLPFQSLGVLARVCKRWRGVANDPSWKPDLVAYAWGDADLTGMSEACPKPTLLELSITRKIINIHCADAATFVVTEAGEAWFWGKSWLQDFEEAPDCREPTRLDELRDVVAVTTSPAGYFHERSRLPGYPCAALTRSGSLYTWGLNLTGGLLHDTRAVERPRKVDKTCDVWRSSAERVLHVGLGLDYMVLCLERTGQRLQAAAEGGVGVTSSAVLTCGTFSRHQGPPHELHEWEELRGVHVKTLVAGSFHCCALTTRGELYTWGHEAGTDGANGNLLGHGERTGEWTRGNIERGLPANLAWFPPPRLVECEGFGPVAEVKCSSYTTAAILVDGRVFSWGDCDGNALGHEHQACDRPRWLRSLRWHRVAHGAVAYTNAAVATQEGRVFVWGGNYWDGGIAQGRNSQSTTEVHWQGVPSCYKCSAVALGHRHGLLVFHKQP